MAKLQKDLREFVELLLANNVDFLVVGAHALAFHARPRYTQAVDFFVRSTEANAENILKTIRDFGFESLKLTKEDFTHPDQVIQLGMPPNRIDILTKISDVSFDEAWPRKVAGTLDGLDVFFISREDFVKNKQALGRRKDLADVEEIERTNG